MTCTCSVHTSHTTHTQVWLPHTVGRHTQYSGLRQPSPHAHSQKGYKVGVARTYKEAIEKLERVTASGRLREVRHAGEHAKQVQRVVGLFGEVCVKGGEG